MDYAKINSWFDKLSAELHTLGFVPSVNDPCMFVHPDMTVLVYCDDCLIFSREQSTVDAKIVRMGEAFPGGITVENSVFAFLGASRRFSQRHQPRWAAIIWERNV
jgi:hypothetical protein